MELAHLFRVLSELTDRFTMMCSHKPTPLFPVLL